MRPRPAVRAGLMAAALSGAPSTLYAFVAKDHCSKPPRQQERSSCATRPAGAGCCRRRGRFTSPSRCSGPTARADPSAPKSPVLGSAGGLAIGALDLVIIGRRWPRIRKLPLAPQLADHVAFGTVVAALLDRPPAR